MYEKALRINASDSRVWAGLGATYRVLGSGKLSQESYQKAVDRAEVSLSVNPNDPILLCTLAGYYVDLGRRVEGRSFIRRALSLAPNNPNVLGRAGIVHEQLGGRREALKYLEKAIKSGFSTTEINYDPEMKGLREDPEFQKILKKVTKGGDR
jgi:Tfp pilus assembly protein PilF